MAINEEHLRKRYASYPKRPKLREQRLTDDDDHQDATAPVSLAHILVNPLPAKPTIFAAKKWVHVVHADGTITNGWTLRTRMTMTPYRRLT
jgi:hypothetical protein